MDAIPGGCHKPAQHGYREQFGGTSELLTNYEPVAVYLKRIG
jgi:hypothetical protein